MLSRPVFLLCALAGLGVMLGAGIAAGSPAAGAQAGRSLEGSWITDVTVAETGERVVGLFTYTGDGGMVSTNTTHPRWGPAHGAWVRTGEREFAITFQRLRFESDGTFIGTHKVRGRLTLNDALDEYSSQSLSEQFDRDGNLVSSGPTTGQAKRIKVEPMP